jgi:lactoylglutathione lyase
VELAKPQVDIGLSTNSLQPMLAFWQGEAGLPLDHVLPIRPGHDQHRHDALGSVVKVNHHADPLPDDAPPSGYVELLVAREGLSEPLALVDPDGNKVSLVPPGWQGVTQVGIRIACRDLAAHRRFYGEGLGLPEEQPGAFRAGESLILLEESPNAPADAGMRGKGWRYITFQVFKVDQAHADALGKGAREAMAPVTLGQTARISMIRDPDGNWIELSQRASIVGSLS